jgi:DNA invertase Pin-like site-specific DNA recombinase
MSERAGQWRRVSSGKQDEAGQDPDNLAWIKSHGYDLGPVYTVHGGSAFKGNRKFDEAWASVLADMKAGRIKVLVVWKQDRIDRKLNTFQMLAQVVEAGGRVEFVTQPHLNDLTTMGGRISLKVQEEIAYAESKDKSDRIKAKQVTLRAAGALTSRPPFGYESVPAPGGYKMLVPTGDGRAYVPEIFSRVIAGESLRAIAKFLDDKGVKPVSGKTFWAKTLADMVRCATYAGRQQDANGRTIHLCEALVDANTFSKANKALDTRPNRGARLGDALLGPGVLACPACSWSAATRAPSSPMYRLANAAGRRQMYRCGGTGSQRRGCGNNVDLAAADQALSRFMAGLDAEILTTRVVPGHDHRAEMDAIKMDLRALDPDAGDYDGRHAALRAELARLKALPSVPDRIVTEPTGVTYGQAWQALDESERAAWLRSKGVRVYAARTAAGTVQAAWDALNVRAMAAAVQLEAGDVSAIVTWAGGDLVID